MTREELEQAIENGESVWIIGKDIEGNKRVGTKGLYKYDEVLNNKLNGIWNLNKIYKTKAEAEHYLHHANVNRTETLPFLTWEEFLEEGAFDFYSENHEWFTMYWNDADGIVVENIVGIGDRRTWDLTEANFYKAYDECVRLFRSEE